MHCRFSTGLLLALQTDKDYYGRGYGALVVKAISKQIAEIGHDLHAGVFAENTPSRKLFERIGYTTTGNVHWVSTKFQWPAYNE